MDATRFDALTRNLSSRRTVLTGVAGGGLGALLRLATAGGDAAAKDCPRGKKECGKRCIPKNRECCKRNQKPCGKKCIAKSKCCTNADCGLRRLCAKGICVTGQGTCAAGADACADGVSSCGLSTSACLCFETTTGQTRCGEISRLGACGGCLTNADCARDFPDIPGMFCSQSGQECGCGPSTVCRAPCPD